MWNDSNSTLKQMTSRTMQHQKSRRYCSTCVVWPCRNEDEGELERLQKEGIIEAVQFSKWAAPIVTVVKAYYQICLGGNYRLTINQTSKLEVYPLPKIYFFCMNSKEKTFSKLDPWNCENERTKQNLCLVVKYV